MLTYWVHLFLMAMAEASTSDFFAEADKNLTKITWAHAVNNMGFLTETLNSSSINMIEADIIMGRVDGASSIMPIMGHPPAAQSDLSLEEFLHTVSVYNHDHKNSTLRKGIKLDFKSTHVFEQSIPIIKNIYERMDFPMWLNADIIAGPLNATTIPVDADTFLSNSTAFPRAALSLGWTTNYGQAANITSTNYTDAQINQMLNVINRNQISQEITFAVRAGIVANSLDQMKRLKETVTNSTLTIWSSVGDEVDVDQLRQVIFEYGLDRVYVDVPKELEDQLNLGDSDNAAAHTHKNMNFMTLLTIILIVTVAVI